MCTSGLENDPGLGTSLKLYGTMLQFGTQTIPSFLTVKYPLYASGIY